MTEHPIPWRVEWWEINVEWMILDANGDFVTSVETKEDADRIVTAVNAYPMHDQLVDIARIGASAELIMSRSESNRYLIQLQAKARAVLAEIEGGGK